MCPEILHIAGPFSIQGYGMMILCAIGIFSWLVLHDFRRKKIITATQYFELLSVGILSALVAGRLMHIFTSSQEFLSLQALVPWTPGFSILGSILGLLIVIPWYLWYHRLPVLPILDLAAKYALLMQSIARIGCFLAGCCSGIATNLWYGIRFAASQDRVHATQLYSAALLLLLFGVLYLISKRLPFGTGMISCVYLMFATAERFIVDFLRADREFFSFFSYFSINQCIALFLFAISSAMMGLLMYRTKYRQKDA